MTARTQEELNRARREDFEFLILCHAKGNAAMYDLLRDRSLDKVEPTAKELGELEYTSWFTTPQT